MGICMHMCMDMCMDKCMDTCTDRCMDRCMDMCMDICMNMCTALLEHELITIYRHVDQTCFTDTCLLSGRPSDIRIIVDCNGVSVDSVGRLLQFVGRAMSQP